MPSTSRRTLLKLFPLGALGAAMAPLLSACGGGGSDDAPAPLAPAAPGMSWADQAAILARIQAPVFPDREFRITDAPYKADATGSKDVSSVINQAIIDCSRAGGGRVVVPAGTFLSAGIVLKSRVNLHFEDGARINFIPDRSKYHAVFTRYEGVECINNQALIYAFNETDIALTGKGIIDGDAAQTRYWYNLVSAEYASKSKLLDLAALKVPPEHRVFAGPQEILRPNFVQFYACRNVLIEDITVQNSPMWNLHPVLCENVTVRGVTIDSFPSLDANGKILDKNNTDGCDPESCRDVLIENCTFITRDDAIALKSGKNDDGRRVNKPSENTIIRNCQILGHGSLTCGSECTGGIRNVFIENCVIGANPYYLAHASAMAKFAHFDMILFKNNANRGGVIENIFVRNIQVDTVIAKADTALVAVDFGGETYGAYFPTLRNVQIEGVTAKSVPRLLHIVSGTPRDVIQGVVIRDCRVGGLSGTDVVPQGVAGIQPVKLESILRT